MSVQGNFGNPESSSQFRNSDRLKVALIGLGVVFASLGLGEAVYRLAFFDFDGATDRLPIEMLFGLLFAWMVTKVVGKIHQHRLETSARIDLVWERNHKIRHAVENIVPFSSPGHQQAIRVIRDEVERIEWALSEIRSR